MKKVELLHSITENIKKKHPWQISQEKYQNFFGELPREFLQERQYYDNLIEKSKQFKLCFLSLSQTKIEIKLTLDQLITWEIARWEEAGLHNILPGDVKKLLKTE